LEAAIHVLVPISAVTWLVGQKGVFSVIAATLVGIPLPLHQIPAIPVLAGLKAKGMVDGADIAFLMAGQFTSLPAIMALYAIFIPRVVVTFVALGVIGSVFLGLLRMYSG
ncbi:permease, partial [bacterium]